jgi:SPASM domain peptide maturase of grasp-with-spasm system
VITLDMLSAPSAATFFENKLFNGCLNRKVGIDADGRIKNCPSMAASFGNVRDTRLADVVRQDRFQAQWSVTKDGIATCRGCELRYACSDCRAFVEDPQNGDSKPLKCGYDPALGAWTDGIETG